MNKVLIVDNSEFMRDILGEILTKGGFEIIGEAEDGEKAVEKYKQLLPDFISLDINMPKKDGLRALEEIKNFNSNAKIVMCSSLGQNSYINEAKKMGATEFIIKPFVPEKVVRIFRKLSKTR
ncbi:MAG: response regulator [Candidatus Gastranaerophilaceae bacterium]|jgi:two-component system chemotaxis response regulator CheY